MNIIQRILSFIILLPVLMYLMGMIIVLAIIKLVVGGSALSRAIRSLYNANAVIIDEMKICRNPNKEFLRKYHPEIRRA